MRKLLIIIMLFSISSAITVEQLFNIKKIKVKKETIEDSRVYNGYAKMIDSKIYTITTTQNGFIKNLTAQNIYDRVKKHQRLFNIYSPEVYRAEIELLNALEYSPSLAESIERKLRLFDVSKADIEKIKRDRRAYKYLPFYSPYSGIVIEKSVTEGSSIKKGMNIYKIADLSKIWVVGEAYEKDREYIKRGRKLEITFSGSKRVYRAKIDFIYPFVDRENKVLKFRATIDNRGMKIEPNSYAKIKTIISKRDILVLPNSAVVTKGDKHFVFVPGEYEGEYKSKLVDAKRVGSRKFEIVSGLKDGDEVVNNSLFLLD